jgi:hypothetical protein
MNRRQAAAVALILGGLGAPLACSSAAAPPATTTPPPAPEPTGLASSFTPAEEPAEPVAAASAPATAEAPVGPRPPWPPPVASNVNPGKAGRITAPQQQLSVLASVCQPGKVQRRGESSVGCHGCPAFNEKSDWPDGKPAKAPADPDNFSPLRAMVRGSFTARGRDQILAQFYHCTYGWTTILEADQGRWRPVVNELGGPDSPTDCELVRMSDGRDWFLCHYDIGRSETQDSLSFDPMPSQKTFVQALNNTHLICLRAQETPSPEAIVARLTGHRLDLPRLEVSVEVRRAPLEGAYAKACGRLSKDRVALSPSQQLAVLGAPRRYKLHFIAQGGTFEPDEETRKLLAGELLGAVSTGE